MKQKENKQVKIKKILDDFDREFSASIWSEPCYGSNGFNSAGDVMNRTIRDFIEEALNKVL